MRPKFDPKEEFIVSYYRRGSSSGAGRSWIRDLVVLLIGSGFFAFGVYADRDPTWTVIGFGLVAYRVIQSAVATRKYDGVFTSIIDKYESALDAADTGRDKQPTNPERDSGAQPASRPIV